MRGLHLPKRVLVLAAAASIAVGGTTAMAAHILTAGPQGDGSSVTPNGWFVTPAGRQIDLADATWWADRPPALVSARLPCPATCHGFSRRGLSTGRSARP